MDEFCRACLTYFNDKSILIQYTEKNRRLFIYATGIQVKKNDFFKFQICKDCFTSMQTSCKFKKKCRASDKIYNKFMALRDEFVNFHDFINNPDYRVLNGSFSRNFIEKNKDDVVSASPSNSIMNFINSLDDDMAPTEESLINEVILEDVDLLDDSLDSQWLQEDQIDFRLSPLHGNHMALTEENIQHQYIPNLDQFSKLISTMKLGTKSKSCVIDRNLEKALIRNKDQCFVEDLLKSPSETQSIAIEENNERNQILQDIRLELESLSNINTLVPVKNLKLMKELLLKTKDSDNFSNENLSYKQYNYVKKISINENIDNDNYNSTESEEEILKNINEKSMVVFPNESTEKNVHNNICTKYIDILDRSENIDMEKDKNSIEHNIKENYIEMPKFTKIENIVIDNENINKIEQDSAVKINQSVKSSQNENKKVSGEEIFRQKEVNSETYCHIDKTPWKCKNCDVKTFDNEVQLKNHYANEHDIFLNVIKMIQPKVVCEQIPLSYIKLLQDTIKSATKKVKIKNPISSDNNDIEHKNNTKKQDKSHERIKIKLENYTHIRTNPWNCKHCDRTFPRRKLFKKHNLDKHGILIKNIKVQDCKYNIICPICGKISTHPANAKRHLATHEEKQLTHECKVCKLEFKTKIALMNHARTHEEKTIDSTPNTNKNQMYKFNCTKCLYQTNYSQNLNKHMRIHNKEFSEFCEVCGKGFYTKHFYMRHMRVHTGEKPFSCTQCSAKFGRGDLLNTHIRKHLGERPYICKICDSSFSYRISLVKHKKICDGRPKSEDSD